MRNALHTSALLLVALAAAPALAQDSITGSYDIEGSRLSSGTAGPLAYTGRARITQDGGRLVLTSRLDGPNARGAATAASAAPNAAGVWAFALPASTSGAGGIAGALGGGSSAATTPARTLEVKRAAGYLTLRVLEGTRILASERLTAHAGGLEVVAGAPDRTRFIPYRNGGPNSVTVRFEVEPTGQPVDVQVRITDKTGAEVFRQTTAAQTDAGAGLSFTWDGKGSAAGRPCVDARRSPYRIMIGVKKDATIVTSQPVEVSAVPLVDQVVVASRNAATGDLTVDGKIVGYADRPVICACVRAVVGGARVEESGRTDRAWFVVDETLPAAGANLGATLGRVTLSRWDAATWTPLGVRWQLVLARGLHTPAYKATQNASRMTRDGEFTNVVSNGDAEGTWIGRDTMEYTHQDAGAGAHPTEQASPGTVRYRADADYTDAALALGARAPGSAGRRDPVATTATQVRTGLLDGYSIPVGGVDAKVHRISRRGPSPVRLLSFMETYRGVPWLYGSMGDQVQGFIGYDCADLVFASARWAGLTTRTTFTNAHNFCEIYLKPRGKLPVVRFTEAGEMVDARTGAAVTIPAGGADQGNAQPGDVVFFDWDGDGKWDHTTVLWECPSGHLDSTSRLAWAHHEAGSTDGFHVGTLADLTWSDSGTIRMRVRRF